jgi:hypothetical protein
MEAFADVVICCMRVDDMEVLQQLQLFCEEAMSPTQQSVVVIPWFSKITCKEGGNTLLAASKKQ